MTRPIWLPVASIIMAALVWAILFGYVHAALRPGTEPIVIRPEMSKERDKPAPRCVRFRTAIIMLRFKDGSVMMFPVTRAVPC